jgi:hypothetical protein
VPDPGSKLIIPYPVTISDGRIYMSVLQGRGMGGGGCISSHVTHTGENQFGGLSLQCVTMDLVWLFLLYVQLADN